MKIAIGILLLTALISVLGMFYWMYKSKSGELNLSTDSWHYKLKHWMWDFETYQANNACPYYWGLVFSVLLFPFYCIVKYSVLLGFYIKDKLPRFSSINLCSKLPNIIPPTKKEMYSKVYKNSKKWLEWIFVSLVIGIVVTVLILTFYKLFVINSIAFTILVGFFILLFVHLFFILTDNDIFKEYYLQHVIAVGQGLWNLILIPFLLAYELIRIPIQVIFKVYTNNCPPITWTTEQ